MPLSELVIPVASVATLGVALRYGSDAVLRLVAGMTAIAAKDDKQTRAQRALASLTQRAAGRLAIMTEAERTEVIALLDIQVTALDAGRVPALIRGTLCDIAQAGGCDLDDRDLSSIEA
jgi:hypothetical protein